jgi:hypothetical protein
MFEMGLAYALGKPIVVVGGIQPIFDYLPTINHVRDIGELNGIIRLMAGGIGVRQGN